MSAPPPPVPNMLPSDILRKVMIYVGPGHYRYVAGTCLGFREAYASAHPGRMETSKESIVASPQTAEFYIAEKKVLSATTPRKKKPRTQGRRVNLRLNVACWAARYGELDTLKWTRGQHGTVTKLHHIRDQAAQGGSIDCFNFLHEEGDQEAINQCYFESAARHGRLAFLRHFKEEVTFLELNTELCCIAAQHGQLEVLKFIHEEVSPCPSDIYECAFESAAEWGHLGCLVYLHSTLGVRVTVRALYHATTRDVDKPECLRYIVENYEGNWALAWERSLLKKSLSNVAFHGHRGSLEYLLQLQNVNWNDRDFEGALEESAAYGHLECLSYLLELDNHVWSNVVLDRALIHTCSHEGAPDCLAYLLDLDRDWSAAVIHKAVETTMHFQSVQHLGRLLQVDGVDWDREQLSRWLEDAERKPTRWCNYADWASCLRAFLAN